MKHFFFLLISIFYLLLPANVYAQTAVPTFASIGLYWSPANGSANLECQVQYRPQGASTWQQGYPLWFDTNDKQYRGSLVNLNSNTTYEIQLKLKNTSTQTSLTAKTWSENFPVAKTITVPNSNTTYIVNQSGTVNGYVLYVPETMPTGINANIDVKNNQAYDIQVNASYVIIRGFKLTGAKNFGIYLNKDAKIHDVVIEKNEIWNWGSGENFEGAITGGKHYSDMNPDMKRIIVQRNIFRDPRYGSNDWRSGHPSGPQTVVLFNSGGQNIIRYNEGYSSSYSHYFNDAAGAGSNSNVGYPGADSDIYGNIFKNCYDDGIESDGDNLNVRIWGNYITNCYTGISIAPVIKGPVYIFRNVLGILEKYQGGSPSNAQGLIKTATATGGVSGYGRAYVFHNTTLQQFSTGSNIGARSALCNGPSANVVSRNNVFHLQSSSNTTFSASTDSSNNFDYDLYNGALSSAPSGSETHGIRNTPVYVSNANLTSGYFLKSGTPGYDNGTVLNNFSDGYTGTAPDMGAYESGKQPLEFGITAYLNNSVSPTLPVKTPTKSPTPNPSITETTSCTRKSFGDANCDGLTNGVDYSYWLNSQCRVNASQGCLSSDADFNKDGNIDDLDYQIWFENRET